MKRALVLGGGGSRGAYEMGAWTAFRELGIEFDIVTGTSIGAVNGALYVQGDYESTRQLWETITVNDVMIGADIDLTMSIESIMKNIGPIGSFVRRYVSARGADISPFKKLLSEVLVEERFFASEIDYAGMTVKFPSFAPREVFKRDIQNGYLMRWVLASAAIFPAFPMCDVDGQSYIDGGYGDGVPISTAFKLGADEVVAVNLHTAPEHPNYFAHPSVKTIYPARTLGFMLDFGRAALDKNMKQGYYDTMKAYGRLWGREYNLCSRDISRFDAVADSFVSRLSRYEARFSKFSDAAVSPYLLSDGKDKRAMLVAAAEICLSLLNYDPSGLVNLDVFMSRLTGIAKEYSKTGRAPGSPIANALALMGKNGGASADMKKMSDQFKREYIAAALLDELASTEE